MAKWLTDRYVATQQELVQSDFASLYVFLERKTLIVSSIVSGVVATVLMRIAGMPWLLAGLGLPLGLLGPRLLAHSMRRRRNQRLYEQFPDALGFWSGLLASGQSLQSSLSQLSERQPKPLGDDLRLLVRQARMGMPVEEGMEALCRRVGVADLMLVATLLRVSRELGGNLAESLQRLADVLRERLATEARIRALTAQGKLQGWIVGSLPALLLVVLCAMEPDVMTALFREPLGWATLGLIAALEVTGLLLIRRIVSIDV